MGGIFDLVGTEKTGEGVASFTSTFGGSFGTEKDEGEGAGGVVGRGGRTGGTDGDGVDGAGVAGAAGRVYGIKVGGFCDTGAGGFKGLRGSLTGGVIGFETGTGAPPRFWLFLIASISDPMVLTDD